jgi:hypothetical protein
MDEGSQTRQMIGSLVVAAAVVAAVIGVVTAKLGSTPVAELEAREDRRDARIELIEERREAREERREARLER